MSHSAVAVRQPQTDIQEVPRQGMATIDQERRALWQQLFFDGATDADIEFCLAFCAHRDLDPMRGEVVFNKFEKREKVSGQWRTNGYSVVPVVTAIGYRVQASRSGDYLGQTPREWCGTDGVWKQVWLEDEPPAAARVGILRRGCPQPIYAVAVFKRFAKRYTSGDSRGELMGLWKTNPDVMIATRAETAAFKLAFPETRRQDATPSRIVYRELADGQRLRTIAGAIADDGGDVFPHMIAAEAIADRNDWTEANRELHKLIAEMHPEEPDAHVLVHELVCSRFGVESTKDATTEQLAELVNELWDSLHDEESGEDVIEAKGTVSYGGDPAHGYEDEHTIDPKIVRQWLDHIDRAKNVRAFSPIERRIYDSELDRVPEIVSALAIKRGELGIPDDDEQMAKTMRAVNRTVTP